MDKKGGIKIFRRKFFCLTVPESFATENFCAMFQKNSGSAKHNGLERGVSRSSVERFFVSVCQKVS